ncbi:hypothetical protein ciss_06500 [Carboxydothermus islandicus]|uniref:Uncharacterized protein n=1 Tax=Carboxydothermus islandicus TaxID=661089 RepID=A0A1L8D0R0_9THEO|nr:DUF5685 family protein [Carboxydothermus islandicus]GAV24717.1 hypothetical protein ciss_06500 [Carboxydothermus islandicus]
MFGFFKLPKTLSETDFGLKFKATYCSLCKELGSKFEGYKLFNNYDFTFWALFIDSFLDDNPKMVSFFCPYTLKKKFRYNKPTFGVVKAVYYTKLFMRLKLIDFLHDLPIKHIVARNLFDSLLHEQHLREKNKLQTLEYYGEISGILLGIITADTMVEYHFSLDKIFTAYNLAYFIGRYIYLIDALSDFKKDIILRRFNAVLAAYPDLKNKKYGKTFYEINFVLHRHMEIIKKYLLDLNNRFAPEMIVVLQNSYSKAIDLFLKNLSLREDEYGNLPESWRILAQRP